MQQSCSRVCTFVGLACGMNLPTLPATFLGISSAGVMRCRSPETLACVKVRLKACDVVLSGHSQVNCEDIPCLSHVAAETTSPNALGFRVRFSLLTNA